MPDEADEALKWLAELERKNNMPEKNDNDFIKKLLEAEKEMGHEIRVEFDAGPHIARWAGADDWSIISGSTSNETMYVDFGHVYEKAEPMTYENSHDLSQYKCDHCGRWLVQLWREGHKSYDPPPRVLCIWCVGDADGRDYRGTLEDTEINIDSRFGGWVPAIPYNNQGEYLVIPLRSKDTKRYGVDWWLGLKR